MWVGHDSCEAALIGQNIARALIAIFCVKTGTGCQEDIWEEVRAEADERADYDIELDILGFDKDARMIEVRREMHLKRCFTSELNLNRCKLQTLIHKNLMAS